MEDLKNEKQQIHRRTNCLCIKANRNRNTVQGSDSQDGDHRADLLQVEKEIQWNDAQRSKATKTA